MAVAEFFGELVGGDPAVEFWAYDGSRFGPRGAPAKVVVKSPRALRRLVTAPNELGLGRAYVAGEIDLEGDIFEVLALQDQLEELRVTPAQILDGAEDHGAARAQAAGAAARGSAPPRSASFEGARRGGDRASLRRLERLLPDRARSFDDVLVRGMDRHDHDARAGAGEQVRAGVPEARAPAAHAAARHRLRLGRDGPARRAAPRCPRGRRDALATPGGARGQARCGSRAHGPGRDPVPGLPRHRRRPVRRDQLDRHVRARRLDAARGVLLPLLRACSRPVAGSSTTGSANRRTSSPTRWRGRRRSCERRFGRGLGHDFFNRYIFPDGELHEVGLVVSAIQRAGFEARHVESLREHYALTLRRWVQNLERRLGSRGRAKQERHEPASGGSTSRRRRSASSRIGSQIHQVLATKPADGRSGMPLRPNFTCPRSPPDPAAQPTSWVVR